MEYAVSLVGVKSGAKRSLFPLLWPIWDYEVGSRYCALPDDSQPLTSTKDRIGGEGVRSRFKSSTIEASHTEV